MQAVAVPYPAADEFLKFLDSLCGFYLIWLCPLRVSHSVGPNPDMLLDFGVWGPGPKGLDGFVEANRRLEHKVRELGGRKFLYAHAYYTEEEFRDIHDRKQNDAKYHATYLPSVYEKVRIDFPAEVMSESWVVWLLALFWSIWPFSRIYGVLPVLIGGDSLLRRESAGTRD